jgi:hypothetical protein
MATLPAPVQDVLLRDAMWMQRCELGFLMDATLPPPPTGTSSSPSVNNLAWHPTSQRVRDGRLAPRGRSVRSSTVADALLFVAQAHTVLGKADHSWQRT